MEARAFTRTKTVRILLAVTCLQILASANTGWAVEMRTQNFIIMGAPSAELARQVGAEAERFRKELANKWLGKELPPWSSPCALRVVAGNMPAQGVTTYQRYPGYVGDFQMEVVGSPQRILDSVLPHEITHTVLATHFGRPLPRWADEGISTTVEHSSERSKHDVKLREYLTTRRGIPMNKMFMMKEYPPEMLTLYAQGYSVCRFLIEQKGPREFVKFLETFMTIGNWTQSVQRHYDYSSLAELQDYWLNWVADGSQDVQQFVKIQTPIPTPGAEFDVGSGEILLASGSSIATSSNTRNLNSGGWYANVRDGRKQLAGNTRSTDPASLPAAEPTGPAPYSAAPYSAAQPQPEQGAISGLPAGPSSPWSPQPARIYR